jgi:hypothetical protein
MKRALLILMLAASPRLFAEVDSPEATAPTPPSSGCQILRNAQVTIVVYKQSWAQTNGIWVQSTNEVGRSQVDAPVIGDSMVSCKLPSLRVDNVMINGKPDTINASAWMRVHSGATGSANPYKRFAGNYWLTSDGGRQGWASADVQDLSQKQLSLNMNAESASNASTNHDDIITVALRFTDNAP